MSRDDQIILIIKELHENTTKIYTPDDIARESGEDISVVEKLMAFYQAEDVEDLYFKTKEKAKKIKYNLIKQELDQYFVEQYGS